MADPVSLAASIAGLLMLATSVSKVVYEVVKALKNPLPELSRLSNEIDAIIPILSELRSCTEQCSPESQAWLLRHNFDGAVAGLKASLADAEKILDRFKHANARKERLKRLRWVFEEQKVADVVTCLQRQKVTLLLALSIMGMKSDQQVEDSLKGINNNIENAFTSVQQIEGFVGNMQTVLLQILDQQTALGLQTSRYHQSAQQIINTVLLAVPKSDSPSPYPEYPTTENACVKHNSSVASSTSTMNRKVFSYFASWGILEAAWGSLAFFEPPRPSGPRRGYGIRMTYIPPRWLLRMAFNLSLGLGVHPRLNVHFSIFIAAEVPINAEIFKLADYGDLEGMKQMFRLGKAAPTDRFSDGYTLLHLAVGLRDAQMCRFLLSEGADPAALWRNPFFGFEITPINYTQLFHDTLSGNGSARQAIFEALGYFGTQPPPIELKKKSWVQLALPACEYECAEGSLSMADLQATDLHMRDEYGNTPLHWVCYFTSGDLIHVFIKRGLGVNAKDCDGDTALHLSCIVGNRQGIEELLNAGADWTLSNDAGQTPSDVAAEFGHEYIWDSAFNSFLRARAQRLREERAAKARGGVEDIDYDTSFLFESLEEPVDAITLTPKEEINMTNMLETPWAEKLLHRFSHVLVFLVLLLAAVYLLLKIVECTRSL